MHQSGTVCKLWCRYLYQFSRYKALNIHFAITYTHTHIRTDQLPKTTFLDSGDLKTYKSGKHSTSKILTENTTSITLRQQSNKSKKDPQNLIFQIFILYSVLEIWRNYLIKEKVKAKNKIIMFQFFKLKYTHLFKHDIIFILKLLQIFLITVNVCFLYLLCKMGYN